MDVFGDASIYIVGVVMMAAYIGLLKFGTRYPELHMDDPDAPIEHLPDPGPTLKSGPALPAAGGGADLEPDGRGTFAGLVRLRATVFLMFILITQRPIIAHFRKHGDPGVAIRQGFQDLPTAWLPARAT
ncbi:hypothetical protein [Candidatus Accumulibacter sp. ACC012]|uniref:hypothetical protein n=1 Tax=Candidatus Accumulibacter sp. ACC012 TaxID=2823332 RepID=UPI0025BA3316|nr:hypothetical protein [Candidatus Accumulibacter sp. ACC012]